uniref:Uncharacterized protein n=1 Tax=Rhizophora mucronata TaxID=61149 RepID=A0A2P2NH67_RHIMU
MRTEENKKEKRKQGFNSTLGNDYDLGGVRSTRVWCSRVEERMA